MDLAMTRTMLALFEAKEPFALVSTLETRGSSPRHSGAAMVVMSDGGIIGTIGGGALEARAIQSALEALAASASRLLDYELTAADAAGLGMICGGRGVLLIERLDPSDASKRTLYVALEDLLARDGSGWLVTGISPAPGDATATGQNRDVRRCLVDSQGHVTGDQVCPAETLQELARMGGALDGHTADDRPGVYVHSVGLPGVVYVFGAGHCGRSLVPLLGMLGFRTVVVDDRGDFATADHFPDADAIVVPDSFDRALAGLALNERSYVVIMTRGHLFDRAVLAQALETDARYIGMIGSSRKIASTFQALREMGFGDEDLSRVHAPIGLDIGAETPEEIAVSIAAEIVQIRRSGGRPRGTSG
jgi:xanthine dehydrogenase accessory factor